MYPNSIRDQCTDLKNAERSELNTVRAKYRKLISDVRKNCSHEFPNWRRLPSSDENEIYNNAVWIRECLICGETEMIHGEHTQIT